MSSGSPPTLWWRLDGGGAGAAARLDHVGVQRALHQVAGVLQASGRLLEDADEQLAHDLALVLGVGDPGQALEVAVGRPHVDQLDALVALERLDHLLALALAQQPGVHEHAGELGPDGLVDQRGGHGRVDPTRQGADHPGAAHLGPDGGHLLLDDRGHRPGGPGARQVVQELADHLLAVRRVRHLGVVLHAPDARARATPGRRRARRAEVAVATKPSGTRVMPSKWLIHTVCSSGWSASSPPAGLPVTAQGRAAVLALPAAGDLAAQLLGDELGAVAEAEDGHAQVVDLRVEQRARPRRGPTWGRRTGSAPPAPAPAPRPR